MIKEEYLVNEEKITTIIKAIDSHNLDFKKKLGRKGYSEATYAKYTQLRGVMYKYIKTKKRLNDFPILNINYDFLTSFYNYVMLESNENGLELTRNSVLSYMSNLRKVVNIYKKSGYLQNNPFVFFDMSEEVKTKFPLSKNQIEAIKNYKPTSKSLERIKDRSIVGIYTGMSYGEISSCSVTDMITMFNSDFKYWLQKERGKTDEPSTIPLLAPVLEIIEKYKNDKMVGQKGLLFPQITNQKNNEYLKIMKENTRKLKSTNTHITHTSALY